MKFSCTCGATRTNRPPTSGYDHCPYCGTRPSPDLGVTVTADVNLPSGKTAVWTTTGHRYWPGGDDGLRCMDCDGRPHSHRRYPGDYDYDAIVKRGTDALFAAL